MPSNKQKELGQLLLLIAIITFVVTKLNLGILGATLGYFGIPYLWLLQKSSRNAQQIIKFSLLFGVLFVALDYLCVVNETWVTLRTTFPRIWGVVFVEDIVWGIVGMMFILTAHEYFFVEERSIEKTSFRHLAVIFGSIFLTFLIILQWQPSLFQIPYIYAWVIGIVFLIPTVLLSFLLDRKTLKNAAKTGWLFLPILWGNELLAANLGHWEFMGQHYLGWLPIGFGYQIPLEEFFLVFILGPFAVVSYYEFFQKKHG